MKDVASELEGMSPSGPGNKIATVVVIHDIGDRNGCVVSKVLEAGWLEAGKGEICGIGGCSLDTQLQCVVGAGVVRCLVRYGPCPAVAEVIHKVRGEYPGFAKPDEALVRICGGTEGA